MTTKMQKTLFSILGQKEGEMAFATPMDVLGKVEGAPLVGIIYKSQPPVKSGCPAITRLTSATIQVNTDYQRSVANQLNREGKSQDAYVPGTTWYQTIPDSGIAIHKDGQKMYVRGKLHNSGDSYYFDENGNPIPTALAESYMKPKSPSKNQGTDKPVEARVYSFDNVASLQKDGRTYLNPLFSPTNA